MALPITSAFQKCAPYIGTNIRQCGTVTMCNAHPVTAEELSSIYTKGGSPDFRVLEALLFHDMEIKQCETTQNGLYDFFMANKVAMNRNLDTKRRNSGLLEIAPFVLARQFSPINNAYWLTTGGTAAKPGALSVTGDWYLKVTSQTNIPADTASFPADSAGKNGLRVYIDGKSAGGSATRTSYMVLQCVDNGDNTMWLSLKSQNTGSYLSADKLGAPVTGLLRRGTPNVNSYEKFCQEMPSYINWHDVPFWVEETRTTMCRSQLYEKWRKLSLENPLYREYYDLDERQKNKQLAADWMKRTVDTWFWGKPLPYQNALQYDLLDEIDAFNGISGYDLSNNAIVYGADGGKCVSRRANVVGIYEQLAECLRVADAGNTALNLPGLFKELYNMMRVRESAGHPNPHVFDLFTDSAYAQKFNQAMIAYYQAESGNALRLVKDVSSGPPEARRIQRAEFGFVFETYPVFYPRIELNVITHYYFDDWLAGAKTAFGATDQTAQVVWILDFQGIYPGVVASKNRTATTGDKDALAKISASYACVMETLEQTQELTAMLSTIIVECPAANLIIENIDGRQVPSVTDTGANYPGSPGGGEPTTTTPSPWTG